MGLLIRRWSALCKLPRGAEPRLRTPPTSGTMLAATIVGPCHPFTQATYTHREEELQLWLSAQNGATGANFSQK